MKRIILLGLLLVSQSVFAQKEKAPFKERTFKASTGQGKLMGVLTVPRDSANGVVCVIVPGSGPTDKNGNSGVFLYTNAYKMLAEELAKNGYSVVRYDKRGIGESKYVYNAETELTFDLYSKDVNFIITRLKNDKDFRKIVLIGHSEGALLSIKAALNDSISGLVSLAGVGQSADSLLLKQLDNLPADLKTESKHIIQQINVGKTVDKVSEPLMSVFRPSIQPYLRTWFRVNPAFEISKLNIPILIVQGGTDIQVGVEQSVILREANPNASYTLILDMNHVLKRASSDRNQNIKTYGDPNLELHPDLVPAIIQFLKELP